MNIISELFKAYEVIVTHLNYYDDCYFFGLLLFTFIKLENMKVSETITI